MTLENVHRDLGETFLLVVKQVEKIVTIGP